MATWYNLVFVYQELLAFGKMNQLDGNFDALAEGSSGAPKIQTNAININANLSFNNYSLLNVATFDAASFSTGNEAIKWDVIQISLSGTGYDIISYSQDLPHIRGILIVGSSNVQPGGVVYYAHDYGNINYIWGAYDASPPTLYVSYGSSYIAGDQANIIIWYIP